MNKALTIATLILFVLSPSSLFAQSLKNATVAFRAGDWKVLRTVDPMKDTTNCTGIYKENYAVQLTSDTLFIGIQGGIESVTLRFGEKPARGLRLAQEMEKKIRSIVITGSDFSELTGSGRLRYQASTLVSGIKSDEIQLAGFEEALANIRSGCPLQAEAQTATKTSSPMGTLCTGTLVERMRAQGIKDDQIQNVCR